MKKQIAAALLTALVLSVFAGCSSVGPRKYVFFGDPKPEKVEMFEDYWEDYPFRPDDPELPLRRGKGGVIRFFKKGSYSRSILVDGDLTVNVYYSQRDGITLTQPDSQMHLTSAELNEKHRRFSKENGYSYHVFLDLGEYDQPEAEITILSVFKDAKTGQATLSKEIRTSTLGTSPPVKEEVETPESDAEKIARRILGSDEEIENPIAELQARYSVRVKAKEDQYEATKDTRLRESVDVSDSKFEDLAEGGTTRSVSYLEQAQRNRDANLQKIIDENQAKEEYYREKRLQETENYKEQLRTGNDGISALRDAPGASNTMNFNNVQRSYVDLQKATAQKYESISNRFSERAMEEYAKGPQDTRKGSDVAAVNVNDATSIEGAKTRYSEEYQKKDQVYANPLANGYEQAKPSRVSEAALKKPSELDSLDDLIPDSFAQPTEVYVKKN